MKKEMHYAGFWKRIAVMGIEISITNTIFIVLSQLALLTSSINQEIFEIILAITIITSLTTMNIFLYFSNGKTIGDYVMKTRLVDAKNQQQKPKNKKLIGRFFVSLLSFSILGIGFMRAGWTNQKQALHDTISGTRYIEEVQYSGWRTALIIIGSILIDISAHLLSL